MQMRSRRIAFSTLAAWLIFAGALVLFVLQLRTLYTIPVYDSVRWGGDETWLMREFGNQIKHCVMSYPENFGGPRRTDGVLAGSMWVDALIYGLPGALLFPSHDYVSVGRTVTAVLALFLLASIFFILRKLKVSYFVAALTVFLVVACRGFVWASHSARYDLLTGLTLIWFCYFLSRQQNPSTRRMAIAGFFGALMICFSRHMLLLGLAASMAFLIELRVWKKWDLLWVWLAGSAIGAGVLSLAYLAGAHEFSLFGRGGSEGSYSFVLNQIPILRPFSRNVQVSNLVERFHLFERDATWILVILAAAFVMCTLYRLLDRNGRERFSSFLHGPFKFWFLAAGLCSLTWLLAEGSRPYYLYHIVPLLSLVAAIAFDRVPAHSVDKRVAPWFLLAGCFFAAREALPPATLGVAIAQDQQKTISKFLDEARTLPPTHSRILLDVAGLDRALTDTSRQVLTLDMFQPPHETGALVQKLLANHIDYVILRSSPVGTPFEPGRALLPHVLDSIGTIQDTALGFFYDDGRSYDASLGELLRQGLDTLKLYRLPEAAP